MSNVQWISYLVVRLYLSKCDVCVLNHIWINPKRFLIILYVFGSDFYHSLCLCLVFTLFFIVLPCSVLKNRCQCFSRLSWRLASRETPVASSSRSFWRLTRGLLATHSRLAKIFTTETRDSRLTCDSLATRENFRDWTSRLAQSRNTQKQLFKGLFVGNLF